MIKLNFSRLRHLHFLRPMSSVILSSIVCLGGVVITACSSTPTAEENLRYYYLQDQYNNANTLQTRQNQNKIITLTQVNLADYLDQPGIVVEKATQQVQIAKNNLWAERLTESVPRLLRNDLIDLLPNNTYFVAPNKVDAQNATSVDINLFIHRFNLSEAGPVTLSGEYTIIETDNHQKKQERVRRFSLTEQPTTSGYAASIQIQRMLLKQLASLIAQDVR